MLFHDHVYLNKGTRSYKQPLDYLVWSHCFLYEARKAPLFYDKDFEDVATAILSQINITRQDITVENSKAVYLHLCATLG